MNMVENWAEIECLDLSVTLSERNPVSWPTLPQFRATVLSWFDCYPQVNGETGCSLGEFYDQQLLLDEHSGTHVDFPRHILRPEELPVDPPLRRFSGPAAVMDATRYLDRAAPGASPRIPVEDVFGWERRHGELQPGDVMLVDTGYVDRYFAPFPEGRRFLHAPVCDGGLAGWPVPSEDFLRLMAARGVLHVGVSSPSIGALDDPLGTHRTGMRCGMTFTENLTGLRRLPPRGAFYVAAPLKIAGQSGSPVRALAFIARAQLQA